MHTLTRRDERQEFQIAKVTALPGAGVRGERHPDPSFAIVSDTLAYGSNLVFRLGHGLVRHIYQTQSLGLDKDTLHSITKSETK